MLAGAHAGLGQVGGVGQVCVEAEGRERVEGKDADEETLFSFHFGTVCISRIMMAALRRHVFLL